MIVIIIINIINISFIISGYELRTEAPEPELELDKIQWSRWDGPGTQGEYSSEGRGAVLSDKRYIRANDIKRNVFQFYRKFFVIIW